MAELANTAMQVAVMLLGAGAIYGGIRADLKDARRRADEALCRAEQAHRRIDDHVGLRRRHSDE